jgi:hypothetical protein
VPARSCRWRWRAGGEGDVTTKEVAARLARLEAREELSYRGVVMHALVVDRMPQRTNGGGCFYRLYVLQALAWPPLSLPQHHRSPYEWRSEVLTLPRPPADARDRLMRFEVEFAIRSFLYRIEREIDEVFQRSADHNKSWPRRGNHDAALMGRPDTS